MVNAWGVTPQERRALAADLALMYEGVLHRKKLREVGIGREAVRTECRAQRWASAGRHTVVIGGTQPVGRGLLFRAVWESGSGAALDGAAGLLASGLTGFEPSQIDVSLPARSRCHQVSGVKLHRRDAMPPCIEVGGLRTIEPARATLNAASWAVSDRQAAYILVLAVQQHVVSANLLLKRVQSLSRLRRGPFVRQIVLDIADGARALSELDFAQLCRKHGLPQPSRQVMRKVTAGKAYLDCYWENHSLVVEIDGSHHLNGLNPVDDALRANDVTLGADRVLRIPLVGLRTAEDAFMRQVRRGLGLADPS